MTTHDPSIDSDALVPPPVTIGARPALPARRRRRGYGRWIGLAALVAIIALIASTVRPGQGALTYSKYVDEVLAEPQRYVDTDLRVEGIVAAGTLQTAAGSDHYAFAVERNHRSMPVQFNGVVPDSFREGIGVTVHGRLQRNGQFAATEVVAKCPSRYEMQAAANRGERMPGGIPNTPR
jgi:cytochrome c-type biogenesis protein CcmE